MNLKQGKTEAWEMRGIHAKCRSKAVLEENEEDDKSNTVSGKIREPC